MATEKVLKANVSVVLSTAGDGYWSNVKRDVVMTHFELHTFEYTGGCIHHLRAYFREDTWNVEKDGLIYTDNLFLKLLKTTFAKLLGKLDYSEQGMQGDDYVDFDVDAEFAKRFRARFGAYDEYLAAGGK